MKKILMLIAMVAMTISGAAAKTLTSDPLTGLPLIPSTDSRLHLGNEPTVLPEAQVCKSKIETDFYAVFDMKFKDTVSWYESRLSGFKKTHGTGSGRPQTTFYKSDGSVVVSITGEPGTAEDANTHSVSYSKLSPGLTEKTIVGMNVQKMDCQ